MPEQFRYGVNFVVEALQPVVSRGLKAVLLFGVPSKLPKVSMMFIFCIISIFILSVVLTISSRRECHLCRVAGNTM